MKKSYYRIAIERYFCTPLPYILLASVPLMLYGYYENDVCFWVGLVATVLVIVANHALMNSLTRTFGIYATKKQVTYVSFFLKGGSKVFSEQESGKLMEMIVEQSGNQYVNIDDYINYINKNLKEKADNGSAEAVYWLGIYHRRLGEAENHNMVARELIEKAAEMGFERAKKLKEKAKKWR